MSGTLVVSHRESTTHECPVRAAETKFIIISLSFSQSTLILLSPGRYVTPRSVVRSISSKKRPETKLVKEQMQQLNGTHGEYIKIKQNQFVFFKQEPSKQN